MIIITYKQINKSRDSNHWFNIIYFHLTVRTRFRVVIFHALPAHDHMPAIKKDEVSNITVANDTHLILWKVLCFETFLETGSTVSYFLSIQLLFYITPNPSGQEYSAD
jgi:hypothetical protein